MTLVISFRSIHIYKTSYKNLNNICSYTIWIWMTRSECKAICVSLILPANHQTTRRTTQAMLYISFIFFVHSLMQYLIIKSVFFFQFHSAGLFSAFDQRFTYTQKKILKKYWLCWEFKLKDYLILWVVYWNFTRLENFKYNFLTLLLYRCIQSFSHMLTA